jgi:ribonuclease HI
MGIHDHDWDVVIVGDGSGGGWDLGCGWAAVLIDHYTNLRKQVHGSWSCGTSYIGELMAYLHAMVWYSSGVGHQRIQDMRSRGMVRPVKVHIITDSEILVNQGNGGAHRKAARELWASMDAYITGGYQFHWHWCPRDTVGLNMLTDHLSRESRQAIQGIVAPDGTTVYDYNPG